MSAAWEVEFRKGIWLPQVGWWLDAQARAERSFVTHAHSDHIARHKEIICTRATARFLGARLPGRRTLHEWQFGQTHPLEFGVRATLHPAGHILGSAQVLLESDRGSLLYTGDFKLRPSLAAEPCATPRADTLIMETTFALPRYAFPPQEEVIARIVEFCQRALADGATPALLCYSLGKSQEVLRAVASAGAPVMLERETLRLTQIYAQLGTSFPPFFEFDWRNVAGHIVICPPNARGLLSRIPAVRTAVITGWALDSGTIYRSRCDAAFPLSDHADFNDLLRFVELVQPKRVFTLHGYAREFAQTLRARGLDALALGHGNQLEFALPG
ncbi:MAG: MBL fold metallo-hydrolase [Verrucomicrobia bacterium]|nr:MBL fold metallo-hydrolase [Verrucomicrobiota bacterium]